MPAENESRASREDSLGGRGYVAYLRRRIDYLESLNHSTSAIGVDNATEAAQGDASEIVSPQQRLVDAAVNEVEYLSVAAMSGPKRPHQLVSNNSSFASLVTAASKMAQEELSALSGRDYPAGNPLVNVGSLRELSVQSGHDYEYFTNNCHHNIGLIFPCLFIGVSIESFWTMTAKRTDDGTSALGDQLPEVACVAYATLSLGISSSPNRRALKVYAYDFAAKAAALLPQVATEACDEEIIRCTILVALVLLHFRPQNPGVYLLGLAMTKAISTGMHRRNANSNDETTGASLFWTLYVLDRTLSVVMDRPFHIEDGDINLEMSRVAVNPPHSHSNVNSQSFFMWTVHYAQMLSDWRCGPHVEITVCLSSLEYWYQSTEDIIDVVCMAEGLQSAAKSRLATIFDIHKEQLNCRALIQLLYHCLQRSLGEENRLRLCGRLNKDAPRYISNIQLCIDKNDLAPTVLDAIDVLGATIAYIYSCLICSTVGKQDQGATMARAFGIADMKVVMTAMAVLHKIADGLTLAEDFHEFLWMLLSTIETKVQTPQVEPARSVEEDPRKALDHAMARVGVRTPAYWIELLGECM
ncbi:hypothetical protein PV08_00394 [Exophiala spinifera]|uniref:Xylanolytic transcriptional activator regulatory domain-containing protein n=1 Tax=Exophiala spinifera TaxID=91928 RepID=A0A0D2C8C4_9EURO|nr:uncharacterized protein PV08_00394 [Exophiala spinifera]KIW19819.1 hypothetical protein PV08_00394 [Exophiala spinifera]